MYIKLPFLSISVCFGIGATICLGQEIQYLPYVGFYSSVVKSVVINQYRILESWGCYHFLWCLDRAKAGLGWAAYNTLARGRYNTRPEKQGHNHQGCWIVSRWPCCVNLRDRTDRIGLSALHNLKPML